MTIRLTFLLSIVCLVALVSSVTGQIDSVLGQVTSSSSDSYVGGISGNGRFIVFESTEMCIRDRALRDSQYPRSQGSSLQRSV